ncbi:MAG TPA: hypothetical protein VH619_10340 [Verrucomicrobiae bacterium]|nr:hypothetical protein [Verrucomicrobiae bacterium]
MNSKNALRGLAMSIVLHFGVLAGSAQTNIYLFSGSKTNITLAAGTYIITAYGAPGGSAYIPDVASGGLGAEMSAEFNFSTSTNLTLLVGGGGGGGGDYDTSVFSGSGGGGGGSFVVEGSTPLVIAGGGGGWGRTGHIAENGNVSTKGGAVDGSSKYGRGGTNGGGGAGGYSDPPGDYGPAAPGGGGGGGGFLGNGAAGTGEFGSSVTSGAGGINYAGGAGGGGESLGGYNGFGGAGGYGGGGGGGAGSGNGYAEGDAGGGGGGGYSGGGGGSEDPSTYGGGGGGSIIDSSAITNLAEVPGIYSPDDAVNGEIIITAVPTPLLIPTHAAFGFTNGVFGFNVIGPSGSNAVIQASTDLKTWIPLQTNLLGNGPLYFSDAQSTTNVQRFYRAQLSR